VYDTFNPYYGENECDSFTYILFELIRLLGI